MPLKRENRKRSAAILAAEAGFQPATRAQERARLPLLFPTEKLITRCNSFMHCLYVRQPPCLLEECFFRSVEAEQHFELPA